jgi:hypothetical protein
VKFAIILLFYCLLPLRKQFRMSRLSVNIINSKRINPEYLIINKSRGKIKSRLLILTGTDKDSKQIIHYLPSLEISGYGATEEKAYAMLNDCVKDFFKYILESPVYKVQNELRSLGWIQSALKKIEYSKSFVDITGGLKNFNVKDKVELGFIEA